MHIFADGFTNVSLSNGNLRVVLIQNGPDKKQVDVGTLIVPINQAANFVNSLAGTLKQLDEQIKAQTGKKEDEKMQ